jgi:isochorismate pyruvate lyase
MAENLPDPAECTSMEEVRAGVDALDAMLVDLLAQRFAYMRAAARLKPQRNQVRDEARKAQVIANARARAEALDLPGDLVGQLWDHLVEGSIAYELERWDESRSKL